MQSMQTGDFFEALIVSLGCIFSPLGTVLGKLNTDLTTNLRCWWLPGLLGKV